MKSPWSFFSKLTSRRGLPSPIGPFVRTDEFPKAIDADVVAPVAVDEGLGDPVGGQTVKLSLSLQLKSSTATLGDAVDLEPPISLPADVEEAQTEAVPTSHASPAAVVESARPTKSRQTRGRATTANSRGLSGPIAVTAVASEPDVGVATPLDMPVNVAMTLDDEIKVIRSQLAEKLALQNDQLREMLARFES